MEQLIGHTPMVKITYRYQQKVRHVFAKLEYYNLSGSIKDRVAYYIMQQAYLNKTLKENQPIVEATSGNTGISFAALGAFYHHPVHIFMPDWVSKERIKLMQMYGAHVHLVSKEEGGFQKAISLARELAKEIDGFLPEQFCNLDNVMAHYETTGREMIQQLSSVDISSFVSGIGTGGTLMGVGKRLKESNPFIKVIAMEPQELPLLTTGIGMGQHKIEGIGDDFIPDIVDREQIDQVILVHDEDAVNMSRLLASKLGLAVGISSGANFLAAVLSNEDMVVTVFPDDAKKYISTSLSEAIDPNLQFISNQVELLQMEVV